MMKMKKLMVFLCAMFLVFSVTGIAGAVPVYVSGVDASIGWSDADKTGGDFNLCWAASASNALSYTGWTGTTDGTDSISSADNIFGYFKTYWPDDTGAAYYGHEWWFTGSESDPNTDPTGGGGFYADQWAGIINAYFGTWLNDGGTDTIDKLEGFISEDRGITLSIAAEFGHDITLWGIDTIEDELYITDSDDNANQITTYSYYASGGYYFIDDYTNPLWQITPGDAQITGITGLLGNSTGIGPYYEDYVPNQTNGAPVPEPATMLLLGTGLAGLAGFGRKKFFHKS